MNPETGKYRVSYYVDGDLVYESCWEEEELDNEEELLRLAKNPEYATKWMREFLRAQLRVLAAWTADALRALESGKGVAEALEAFLMREWNWKEARLLTKALLSGCTVRVEKIARGKHEVIMEYRHGPLVVK